MGPVIGLTCDAVVPRPAPEGGAAIRRHAVNDPYVACVLKAGGLPVLLPNPPPALAAKAAAAYLSKIDGLLLTGGDDVEPSQYGEDPHPRLEATDAVRDAFEIALVRAARKRAFPVLGICRGVQVMNVALGGTLIQDIPTQIGASVRHRRLGEEPAPSHTVVLEKGTRLREIVGGAEALVNSYHHQAPDRVAPGLRVSVRTQDSVVEGLEDGELPFFLGVQWHPERSPDDPLTAALFRAFLAAAGAGSRPAPERRGDTAARLR